VGFVEELVPPPTDVAIVHRRLDQQGKRLERIERRCRFAISSIA
jgi:hypothetical protein